MVRPRLSWTFIPAATSYHVVLIRTTPKGESEEVVFNQAVDITSVQPDFDLVPGALYRWKVKAVNSGGAGYFTDHQYFRVQCSTEPGVGMPSPVIAAPNVDVATPSVTWRTVPGALEYFVTGQATGGRTLRAWYPAWARNNSAGTCSVRAEMPVPNGAYTWSVFATDGARRGPDSEVQSLMVQAPPVSLTVNGQDREVTYAPGTPLQVVVSGGTGNVSDMVGTSAPTVSIIGR